MKIAGDRMEWVVSIAERRSPDGVHEEIPRGSVRVRVLDAIPAPWSGIVLQLHCRSISHRLCEAIRADACRSSGLR